MVRFVGNDVISERGLKMQKPDILKKVDLKKFKQWLKGVNGHGVWAPEFLEKMGFPRSFVREYTRMHDSLLLNDGKIGDGFGVGEDDFLQDLAYSIGADTSKGDGQIGRGTRARGYAAGCLKVLDEIDNGA